MDKIAGKIIPKWEIGEDETVVIINNINKANQEPTPLIKSEVPGQCPKCRNPYQLCLCKEDV